MARELPTTLNVLVVRDGRDLAERITSVAPNRLRVIEDVDGADLASVQIALAGFPFPGDLPLRLPSLIWAHFTFAGVSNLWGTEWWGLERATVTSSRGVTAALPIAETAVGAALMLAKRLDRAVRLDAAPERGRNAFDDMLLVSGKTLGIVGLGGIGRHVARLARALGMHVVATRRSATRRQAGVDGVDELFPPGEQDAMLEQCDIVVVCSMLTPETRGMLDAAAFAAVKPGAIFVNIARGEIVDENALAEALRSGRVRSAYLDVWHDDIDGAPPSPALREAPNVVFTPHVSGRSDARQALGVDLFVENLERLLRGAPLVNVVDWSRGY